MADFQPRTAVRDIQYRIAWAVLPVWWRTVPGHHQALYPAGRVDDAFSVYLAGWNCVAATEPVPLWDTLVIGLLARCLLMSNNGPEIRL